MTDDKLINIILKCLKDLNDRLDAIEYKLNMHKEDDYEDNWRLWQELEKEVRNGLISVPTTAEMFVQAGSIMVDLERKLNVVTNAVENIQDRLRELEDNPNLGSGKLEKKTYLTPQEIGKLFFPNISAHKVNAILVDLGLQENIGAWVMTDEGKQYGKYIQVSEAAHCKRLKWDKSIVGIIRQNM